MNNSLILMKTKVVSVADYFNNKIFFPILKVNQTTSGASIFVSILRLKTSSYLFKMLLVSKEN